MEKFYLELPTLERKEEALEYINEFVEYKSEINGTGGLDDTLEGMSYEEWLENSTKMQEKEYAKSKNLVPGTTYFMIRESDNKIIGMINIRHYLNDFLRKVGGNIGYSIRPTERRKGYAKIQLYLGLIKALELGIDKAMVDCVNTNIGSDKTIQALGGELFETVYEEKRKVTLNNYWINVRESIEKYKDIYEPYMSDIKTK